MHQLHALLRGLPRLRPEQRVSRPGGDRAFPPLQSRFARPGHQGTPACDRELRGHLGVQLRRRVLGGVPQGRRSGEGDPADKARHHDALRAPLRKPRRMKAPPASAEAAASTAAAPRTYKPELPRGWWLRRRHYFLYIVREFTSVPLALWLLWLLVEIQRASNGPKGYFPHSSAGFIVFSVACLPFALYHSYTFLSLAGVIINLKLMGRPVPSRVIVAAMFGLWLVASIVVAGVLIGFARCAMEPRPNRSRRAAICSVGSCSRMEACSPR